jgi:large subunit ribosomal protein L23
MQIHQIIIKPIVTEKSATQSEQGKYSFVVNKRATKIDIKNAIKTLYGVDAKSVNITATPKKTRIVGRGREITKRQAVKKATVTLEKGKSIDIYKFKPSK